MTEKEQQIVKMRSRMDTMQTLLKSKVSTAPSDWFYNNSAAIALVLTWLGGTHPLTSDL